jgi:hypothetical protein
MEGMWFKTLVTQLFDFIKILAQIINNISKVRQNKKN